MQLDWCGLGNNFIFCNSTNIIFTGKKEEKKSIADYSTARYPEEKRVFCNRNENGIKNTDLCLLPFHVTRGSATIVIFCEQNITFALK
ncbi:unnamed protein product [Ixodes pacificus]